MKNLFLIMIAIFSFLLLILICVAFFTLSERKTLASIQRRIGPNKVGFFGLLQAVSDGLKLIIKELIIPTQSSKFLFIFGPIFCFSVSFGAWAVIPLNENDLTANTSLSLLYVLAMSSLNVFGIIFSGWASNSKYSLLGAIRSAAQLISYEVFMGLSILPVIMISGSLNLLEIVKHQDGV